MMRLRDTTKLAYTKLRTRKVRLFVTVFISCLLFSLLSASSFVFRGAFSSVDEFNQEGFGNRYIIQAGNADPGGGEIYNNVELINQAIVLQKDLVVRKKAEAKRLGIEYDASTEQLPYVEYDGPNGKERSLNFEHPVSKKLIADYVKAHPQPGMKELKEAAKDYQPAAFYESEGSEFSQSAGLKIIRDGKENFDSDQKQMGPGMETGTDSFALSWQLMSGELLEPFMIPGTTRAVGSDGVLPVVAPYTAVEQLLSLKPLPANASPEQKLERLKEVRGKATSVTFSVCYRNQASVAAVSQAVQMQAEILRQKGNKEYQQPSLVYNVPAAPCGEVRITRDVRTADEKKLDEKQLQFRRTFGEEVPQASMMQFRVIGVTPDPPMGAALGADQIFSSILISNIGSGWYTPVEAKDSNTTLATIFSDEGMGALGGRVKVLFADFSTADQALKFVRDKECRPDFSIAANGTNPFTACTEQGKPFFLNPFGSSSIALEGIKKGFGKFFTYAAAGVAFLAALIMMGTVGRIVADSRRETAVFRAIGAKKLDIAQVYVTYILMVALLIATLAVLVGFIIATIVDGRYAPGMTIQALLTYNAKDLTREFHLYGFWPKDMAYLVGMIFMAAIVSAIFPLLNNLRRNPIRDMRDDT